MTVLELNKDGRSLQWQRPIGIERDFPCKRYPTSVRHSPDIPFAGLQQGWFILPPQSNGETCDTASEIRMGYGLWGVRWYHSHLLNGIKVDRAGTRR